MYGSGGGVTPEMMKPVYPRISFEDIIVNIFTNSEK